MELRHLRYFVAVGEELSFSRAARRLHTAQPSLSQQIRDLEREVGCTLLERDHHHVSLTPAGHAFLSEARLTLGQAERAAELARLAVRSNPNQIRVGLLPGYEAFFLSRLLPVLSERISEISLSIRSLPSNELLGALRRATIDVALTRPPVNEEQFAFEAVRDEPLLAILPAKHRLARAKRISIGQLAKERWIMPHLDLTGAIVRRSIVTYLEQAEIEPVSIQETDNVLANLVLVGSGMGVALLPQYVEDLRLDTVICKPLAGNPPTLQLLMVYGRKDPSPPLKSFLAILREVLKTAS